MKKILFLFFCCIIALPVLPQASMTLTGGNNCSGTTKTVTASSGTLVGMTYVWFGSPVGPIFSSPFSASTSVTFPAPGTYTIALTITTANGASFADTVVTILASPSLTLTQSSATTCITANSTSQNPYTLSKPIDITVGGADTYSVFPPPLGLDPNPGVTTVRPATSTCYTFVGLAANGCTASAVTCVSVIPQFTLQVNPSPVTVCLGDSVALAISNIQATATGPSSLFTYNWLEALNAPPPSLDAYGTPMVFAYPQNTTTYTVEMKDAKACASLPVSVPVNVAVCTGVKEQSLNKTSWSFFPNPVRNKVMVKPDHSSVPYNITIASVLGRVVYVRNKITKDVEIDLGFLETGIYLVKLESDEGRRVLKIIKE